jgi:hypothetical protein
MHEHRVKYCNFNLEKLETFKSSIPFEIPSSEAQSHTALSVDVLVLLQHIRQQEDTPTVHTTFTPYMQESYK